MDAGRHTVDPVLSNYKSKFAVDWAPFVGKKWTDSADTALPLYVQEPGARVGKSGETLTVEQFCALANAVDAARD